VATVLDREMYSEAEAARLLRVPPSTLHYWLEGGQRRNKLYRPIIRVDAVNSRTVTWAEFVEASLLREYRRRNVPMVQLRSFIDKLRDEFGVPYPLADRRPFVSGLQLVYDAQTAIDLEAEFCLVAVVNNQLLLTPPSYSFVQRIEWDDDIAIAYRPAQDSDSPVRIVPDIRFGRPSIKGISTEAIWEQADVGVDLEEIAETYGLEVPDVRWALAYENARLAA
jgi:uncharacterized protein (DUF433 family)